MNRIAVVRPVFLPINDSSYYSELTHLKRYEAFVFSNKQKNLKAFPYKNVVITPDHNKLEQMLRDNFFKLIHAQDVQSGINLLKIKRKWKIPLLTSFQHSDSIETLSIEKKKLTELFSVGDYFTVPYLFMKDELIRHGCPANKITVLYSGVDLNHYTNKERTLPSNGLITLTYAGNLNDRSGVEMLIKAFQKVNQSNSKTRLTIIGDGKAKKRLMRLTKELGLNNKIYFKSSRSDKEVVKQLEKSHIYCEPTIKDRGRNRDRMTNMLKAAMACGTPVISTVLPGVSDLIEDNRTGHLINVNNVDAWANKILTAISLGASWKLLSNRARAKIEADYNLTVQANMLEQLYDKVIRIHEQKEQRQPFFSVIIPTHNRERFIKRAINSVLKQTCQDFELIIVDDGSRDQTKNVVSTFGNRIRYVYQEQQGPSSARNTGIQLARGKYIAFLDSDDQFVPEKLDKNKKILEADPNTLFLYSWYYESRKGRKIRLIDNLKHYEDIRRFRKKLYKRAFTIRTSTVVIHNSCFEKVGLFNSKYRYSQDWDMWLRLSCYYKGYCQKTPLSVYRRHPRPKISSGKNHLEIRKNAKKLFAKEGVKFS